ncbi:hypothetical protein BDR05DRAFT_887099, partial [Suillus weaverae]
ELEPWPASDKSYQAGTGVGLVSSAKIVDILKKNPDMDPEKRGMWYPTFPIRDLDRVRAI